MLNLNRVLIVGLILIALSLILRLIQDKTETIPIKSKWIITNKEKLDSFYSTYRAEFIDSKGLNASDTWLIDSSNKFNLKDTISFNK